MKKILLLTLLALPTAACEKAAADRPATQLIAKVNGTEISIHQVRAGAAGNAAQALEKVIDRELLVQKALADKLDRDPQVGRASCRERVCWIV